MPKSKWTKEAILAETRQYAALHGIEWRPALSRMKKDFLVQHLLLEAGYQEHAHQARILRHATQEAQYTFDEYDERRLLDPSYKLPSTGSGKAEKKLSKNARKKLARRKAAQKKANDRASREGLTRKNT
jgi:hypothetical protein